jgi:hypothetical protein
MLIARQQEQLALREVMTSKSAELVAIYGRRREFFGAAIAFELTGSHAASMSAQLFAFATALGRASDAAAPRAPPRTWSEAFVQLEHYLGATRRGKTKRVVFLDELPWLATRRSGFLTAFEHFWNSWASAQPWLVVVICGSSASWMLSKVVAQRGGLYNRVTRRLRLDPFSLAEAGEYLRARNVDFGPDQILELYMAFGGVAHYLNQARPGQSAAQAIERACFARDGMLRNEFSNLYAALFEHADKHEAVVRALAKKRGGMTRDDLLVKAGIDSGGTASKVLSELEESGFIARRVALGHTQRDSLYYLSDHYSLFYLFWIEKSRSTSSGTWMRERVGPRHTAWSGLAFEAVCHTHIHAIKHALGISGIQTEEAPWWHRPDASGEDGAQIDLVIDRADRSINLCEMKYWTGEFVVDKAYAKNLDRKRDVFRRVTRTRKAIFWTLVTTHGVRNNEHTQRIGLQAVTLAALMQPP